MPEFVVLSTDLSLDFIPPLHLGMLRYEMYKLYIVCSKFETN